MRALFAVVMYIALPNYVWLDSQPSPIGLARYFDLTTVFNPVVYPWIRGAALVALLVYVSGYGLEIALPFLAAVFACTGALYYSQGAVGHSRQIVALVALVQALWYCPALIPGLALGLAALWPMRDAPPWIKLTVGVVSLVAGGIAWWFARRRFAGRFPRRDRMETERISVFLTQQAIVAVYVVCAISKILASGFFGWIADARFFPIQIRKNEMMHFYDSLSMSDAVSSAPAGLFAKIPYFFEVLPHATQNLMMAAPWIASFVLALGLLLEMFAWVALLSRGAAAAVGLLLILFHLTVSKVMHLSFDQNIMVLAVYFVQVPFWVAWLAGYGRGMVSAPARAQSPLPTKLGLTLFSLIPAIALTGTLLSLKENFPFSHFPMYASFENWTFYVFVEDRNGNPIPVANVSGVRSSELKKIYNNELKKVQKKLRASDPKLGKQKEELTEEQCRPAAEETLRRLIQNWTEPGKPQLEAMRPLRICKVDLFVADGEITQREYRHWEAGAKQPDGSEPETEGRVQTGGGAP